MSRSIVVVSQPFALIFFFAALLSLVYANSLVQRLKPDKGSSRLFFASVCGWIFYFLALRELSVTRVALFHPKNPTVDYVGQC